MGAQRGASEQLGLRVTPAEKEAVEKLAAIRGEETGDGTVAGWFRAVLRREAKAHGVAIGAQPAVSADRIIELDEEAEAPAAGRGQKRAGGKRS